MSLISNVIRAYSATLLKSFNENLLGLITSYEKNVIRETTSYIPSCLDIQIEVNEIIGLSLASTNSPNLVKLESRWEHAC